MVLNNLIVGETHELSYKDTNEIENSDINSN